MDIPLKKGTLSDWWLNQLNSLMDKHYPDIKTACQLVDYWKQSGWNDGTVTLYAVYELGGVYVQVSFPDYGPPCKNIVKPMFEHTGWQKS